MFGRLRQAIEAGRQAVRETRGEPAGPDARPQPVLALLALDEIGAGAQGLGDRHLAAADAAGARALFVLGPHSAADLARNGRLCEFLPAPEDLARTTADRPDVIERYVRTRLRLVLDKWSVEECRWIGETAAELVDGWIADPDPTLRPVLFRPAP